MINAATTIKANEQKDQRQSMRRSAEPLVLSGAPSFFSRVLQMQRTVGNRVTEKWLKRGVKIQRKLLVGSEDDVFEQEADRVAERVLSISNPQPAVVRSSMQTGSGRVQRACFDCCDELQRKPLMVQCKTPGTASVPAPRQIQSQIEVMRGAGQPLSPTDQTFFEQRFGCDFGGVRVHTDHRAATLAQDLNARAFTIGHDVFLGKGQYAPHSQNGKRLLAHELVHTLQQSRNDNIRSSSNMPEQSISSGRLSIVQTAPHGSVQREPGPEEDPKPGTGAYIAFLGISMVKSDRMTHWASPEQRRRTILEYLRYAATRPNLKALYDEAVAAYPEIAKELGSSAKTPIPKAITDFLPKETKNQPIGEVLKTEDTIPIQGDPVNHANYIQNAVKGVGIFGWGGPFRLDRTIVNGLGVDSIYLPRSEFNLVNDPLKSSAGALNAVYKSRAAADDALKALSSSGMYTYYMGPGGHIYPTIISDTTAPALCAALRKVLEVERTDAKAAENLSVDLALWYLGARFPAKVSEPGAPPKLPRGTSIPSAGGGGATVAGGGQAVSGGEKALVFVELGAGDLKASTELAKKGGVKVIAVDPVAAPASAVQQLESAGGTFVKGTANSLSPGTADHVFQYFPYPMSGAGRLATGGTGTFSLVEDTLRLLKPNGAAHFVTEHAGTAEYLAGEATKKGLRAVITETTAGAAAPGASGMGVPNYSKVAKVFMVNIYK
jgi:hypothetical protein